MSKKALLFAPASFDLAKTTRMIVYITNEKIPKNSAYLC